MVLDPEGAARNLMADRTRETPGKGYLVRDFYSGMVVAHATPERRSGAGRERLET